MNPEVEKSKEGPELNVLKMLPGLLDSNIVPWEDQELPTQSGVFRVSEDQRGYDDTFVRWENEDGSIWLLTDLEGEIRSIRDINRLERLFALPVEKSKVLPGLDPDDEYDELEVNTDLGWLRLKALHTGGNLIWEADNGNTVETDSDGIVLEIHVIEDSGSREKIENVLEPESRA